MVEHLPSKREFKSQYHKNKTKLKAKNNEKTKADQTSLKVFYAPKWP
jgi:hypothetical protein